MGVAQLPAMDLLIFALDGTLIDSKLDLAHAVNAARAHFGLPPLDLATVGDYIGEALESFLTYYGDHKLDNTRAYPGIPEAPKKRDKPETDELQGAGPRRHAGRLYSTFILSFMSSCPSPQ